MYSIPVIPPVRDDLNGLPARRLKASPQSIIKPGAEPRGIRTVKSNNYEGYPLRFGDYPVLCRIDDSRQHVHV